MRRDTVRRLPIVRELSTEETASLPTPLIVESRMLLKKRITFDNPWAPGATKKCLPDHVKTWRSSVTRKGQRRRKDLPAAEVELEAISSHRNGDAMRVTWIGHATLLIQVDGLNILTDPIFSERASPTRLAGPKRYAAPAMLVSDLPRLDVVLVSHNHYDHLDKASVTAIGDGPLWIVPSGLQRVMAKMGIAHCLELSWWEEVEVQGGDGATLMVWLRHHGQPERFFFAGDTAYCPVFGKIRERYGPFDLAAIPIGGYEPRWFEQDRHCSPDEAVAIHAEVGANRFIAVHWGTFPLATEGVEAPPRALVEARRKRGIRSSQFVIIRNGESIVAGRSARRYKCLFDGGEV